MITLEHVCKSFSGTGDPVVALDDVSLAIEAGEFVALRGPSGSGKSTLLSLVGGLDEPNSGKVIVAGADLSRLSGGEKARLRAERIGFVFQLFHLLPYLTVLDNVLAAAVEANGMPPSQRALALLERFQMAGRLRHRPAQLSIGERQRVAMARALVNQPQLVLADEPTGNLDPENARLVLEALAEFRGQGGTVLLVTHEESAAAFAQRTILLDRGRVVEERRS